MKTLTDITLKNIAMMKKTIDTLPWEDREFYALWLSQTYYYVRNATRVLAKAAYRCTHEEEDLHKKMIQGIIEEKNHEIMAVNDLKAIGCSIEEFPEFPSTMAYHQTLLAQIDYHGPYALLGYFVALEGLGAIGSDETYDLLVKKYGKEAAQFLRVHGRVDKHHFDNGLKYIESLPAEKKEIIRNAVEVSSQLYNKMLLEVRDRYPEFKSMKRAS